MLIVTLAFLTLTDAARAVEGYAPTALHTNCNSEWNGGQTDQRGYLYVNCGSQIQIFAPGTTNTAAPVQTIGYGGLAFFDVAPNANGTVIYVTAYANGDGDTTRLRRFVQNANGSWSLDTAWSVAPYSYGGTSWNYDGRFIATDAWGSIYAVQGAWSSGRPLTIIKYDASGNFVTAFGSQTSCARTDPCSWDPTTYYTAPTGVGVSADGRHVYVAELSNGRIHEYDWNNGVYAAARTWGNTALSDPNRVGSCAAGGLAAPYDVAVDRWGFVYVANTTCQQVQKFTATGSWLASVSVAGPNNVPNHGLAVDWNGNIWSGGTNVYAARTTPVPAAPAAPAALPVPDHTAPVVQSVSVPAATSTLTIPVTIVATDDQGVTGLRFIDEAGNAGAWQPYTPNATWTLPGGNGSKAVTVQVEDAAGNTSAFDTALQVAAARAYTVYTAPVAAPAPAVAPFAALNPVAAPVVAAAAATPATVVAAPKIAGQLAPAVPAHAAAAAPAKPVLRRVILRGMLQRTTAVIVLDATGVTSGTGAVRIRASGGGWSRWVVYQAKLGVVMPASSLRTERTHGQRTTAVMIQVQVRGAGGRLSAVRSVVVRAAVPRPRPA